MITVEDSVLNGLVLFAIIIVVVALLARAFFRSKRWKEFNDGEKKAPVAIEVIWILSFIATLYWTIGFGPVGVAVALFLCLSFRIVLVMIYDKFNPDWETDGTQVGVPGLERGLTSLNEVLNRYDPHRLVNETMADLQKHWKSRYRTVTIQPSDPADLAAILDLYRHASDLQREKGMVVWPEIPSSLIKQELAEQRQWKMVIDGQIACIWVVAFDDPLIWGEKNDDPAVYLHRIATAPDFRGQGLVEYVLRATHDMACKMRLDYLRLDTVGDNPGLIEHYTKHGLTYLGAYQLPSTEGLPGHYNDGPVLLFESKVDWGLYVVQSREELEAFTVKELKKMLKVRELPTSGNKSALIDRLLEASKNPYED